MTHTQTPWLQELNTLPVSPYLSQASRHALEVYLNQGNAGQRGYRLYEFLKALDWLPVEEIEPNPLSQLPPESRNQVYRDIEAYFQAKQSKRSEQKSKRDNYRLRVFDYFRTHVSAEDKALLESLRDYELERVGEDINWRHYFWFTSFRQIDAFVRQSAYERQQKITQFKHDVETRYKNEERLREGTYSQYYWGTSSHSGPESFDDWVNRQSGQEHTHRPHSKPHASLLAKHVELAYQFMELSPTASLQDIRQQFRQLTLRYHPDLSGGCSDKMKQLLEAYELLKQTCSL